MSQESLERRVLVLAPTGKDAALTCAVLGEVGIACVVCPDLESLVRELQSGAGAVLLVEEALADGGAQMLAEAVNQQPVWSDLPMLVLTRQGADSPVVTQARQILGNVSLVERPVRVATLVSAVQVALRARDRQYELRNRFEAQALLAAIVASSDDAIISKTLDGIILSWNAAAERMFGYSADEAIGRPITLIVPADRHDEERMILKRIVRGERIDHFETVRVSKDGRPIEISLTISPVRDSRNRVIGASKVARDISAQKRAEEALREADRRKDEFLAMLAHELRNPLAPIRNSIHILRLTGSDAPSADRVCEIMERQVNHMVRLVDDLLDVSRISRGKVELRKEPVELAAVIRNALETSRPLIEAGHHQLAITLPPESLTLDADPMRLAQVFANLLNNAAKYMNDGGQIRLTAQRQGNKVTVSVRDTGFGIPAAMLPRVFDMFTQVNRARGGLGIGLMLVRSLVQMHGGTVEAHSQGPDAGSEFIVHLPLTASHPAGEALPRIQSPSLLSRHRILVVDDNCDAADSLGMLLNVLGTEVQVVHDGPAALKALETYKPSVVVLDIGMPGMDGYEVARRIREQSRYEDVTLIALTGWGQEEDRRRIRAGGFNHHLIKPANITTLEALLVSLDSVGERRRSQLA